MKTLLFIFLFALSLNADSIYSNGKCVKYFYTEDTNQLKIEYSNGNTNTLTFNRANVDFLISNINKFYYENGMCKPIFKTNTQIFMSSLIGILIGFSILFFSIFLTIKIGAKRWLK